MTKARDLANAGTALTTVSATELGYLDGVTSAVQTQINSKIGQSTAINPTIVDAKGDIVAATAADTVARLAVGANDTVLTADSSTATGLKWATPAGGGGWTSLASGSLSGSALTLTSISQSYKNLRLIIRDAQFSNSTEPGIRMNGVTSNAYSRVAIMNDNNTGIVSGQGATNQIYTTYNTPLTNSSYGIWVIDFPDYSNTLTQKVVTCQARYISAAAGNAAENCWAVGSLNSTSAITQIDFRHTVTFTAGTYILYGGN